MKHKDLHRFGCVGLYVLYLFFDFKQDIFIDI